jgi:high-affinity iron transporter
MLPAYILFVREGLEASMIVTILLAALRQLGQPREQVRAVWLGVALAVVASLGGGALLYATLAQYDGSTFQTVFETFAYLVAVVLLTGMTFWMQRHSRSLKRELTAAAAATSGSALALGLLAFTTVGREAVESAIFMLAFAFHSNAWLLLLGALLGVATSLALSWAIYRLGYHLDYRRFFRVMGLLLLLFAAGLLGNTVANMQELGWLPGASAHLWSTAGWLSEQSMIGDVLHSLLGYSDTPTALQMGAYLAFLLVVGGLFARSTRAHPPAAPKTAPAKQGGEGAASSGVAPAR